MTLPVSLSEREDQERTNRVCVCVCAQACLPKPPVLGLDIIDDHFKTAAFNPRDNNPSIKSLIKTEGRTGMNGVFDAFWVN